MYRDPWATEIDPIAIRHEWRRIAVKTAYWVAGLPLSNIPFAMAAWSGDSTQLGELLIMFMWLLTSSGVVCVIGNGPRSPLKVPLCLLAFPGMLTLEWAIMDSIEAVTTGFVQRTKANGVPLIAAIHQYRRERGVPPNRLEDLVPGYLGHLPRTAFLLSPPFDYEKTYLAPNASVWWNLGGISAVTQNESGEVGPVLVLGTSAAGRVVSADLEHLPKVTKPHPFSRARWQEQPAKRFEIAEDLLRQNPMIGMDVSRIVKMLGPADTPGWSISMNSGSSYYTPENWRLGTGNWREISD
jgi:hypothetical protein